MQSGSYHRKILFLWQIRLTFLSFPTIALFAYLNLLLRLFDKIVFFIAISVIFATVICVLLPAFLKRVKLTLLSHVLTLEYGIFFHTTSVLPYNRIIYIKSYKTPLLKALGLVLTIIKTVNGIMILPEIDEKTALVLRQKIKEAAN